MSRHYQFRQLQLRSIFRSASHEIIVHPTNLIVRSVINVNVNKNVGPKSRSLSLRLKFFLELVHFLDTIRKQFVRDVTRSSSKAINQWHQHGIISSQRITNGNFTSE